MTLFGDLNSSVALPFQRWRAMQGDGPLQEGVVGAGDLKGAQRAAGANLSADVAVGPAFVLLDTGSRNGLAHVYNDAVFNAGPFTGGHATLPRVDQVILRWNDSSIPTGAGNTPTIEVLTGTATTGAQITNAAGANYRAGAAALPNDCVRLADILVPATSTSVTTANIVDRRPWARGANFVIDRSGTANLTSTSTTYVDMDATNLKPRIECSGAPLRVTLNGTGAQNAANINVFFQLAFDGAAFANSEQFRSSAAATGPFALPTWEITPAAGSHVIAPQYMTPSGTITIASLARHFSLVIEEILQPSASNT